MRILILAGIHLITAWKQLCMSYKGTMHLSPEHGDDKRELLPNHGHIATLTFAVEALCMYRQTSQLEMADEEW